MTSQGNSFENLISSFGKICSSLQNKAELDLKQIEKDYGEEYASSAKPILRFNELISGIGETCSELLQPDDILKTAGKTLGSENALLLPYEIQSDVVKCINELYNMPPLRKDSGDDKLINEKNKQLVNELIKSCEKNVNEIKNVESAICEAREII